MNAALIPVRGGSKSIPLKNIKPFCGKPLVYWTVKAACECADIDAVYVSTDSEIIKKTVEGFNFGKVTAKVNVIERSFESATDTASTESAALEFAHKYDFDYLVLIQATSPLLLAGDIERGFKAVREPGTDSVLSAVRQKRFNWAPNSDGFAAPINYDIFARPRRQDFEGYFVENGAFYITSKENLLKYKNRISGNIKIVEMGEETFFEIDEPNDWIIAESLMGNLMGKKESRKKDFDFAIPQIKMFITDCDGCLTDGGMFYSENGDELKKFNAVDGMGFQLLRENGISSGIITGESVALVERRAKKLKVDFVRTGVNDKLNEVIKICERYKISPQNIAYVGDDINDLTAVKFVGFGCAPRNAVKQVRDSAKYVSSLSGGAGAVREIIEIILSQNNFKSK